MTSGAGRAGGSAKVSSLTLEGKLPLQFLLSYPSPQELQTDTGEKGTTVNSALRHSTLADTPPNSE